MTGRSFDLQSGKVASTETTLKYHMQINTDELNNENETNVSSEKNSDSVGKKRIDRKLSSTSVHSNTSVSAIIGEEAKKH
jgi:hypothetical protein